MCLCAASFEHIYIVYIGFGLPTLPSANNHSALVTPTNGLPVLEFGVVTITIGHPGLGTKPRKGADSSAAPECTASAGPSIDDKALSLQRRFLTDMTAGGGVGDRI